MYRSDKRPRLGVSPLWGSVFLGAGFVGAFSVGSCASSNLKVSFIGCFRPAAGGRDILEAQEITKEKKL